MNVYFIRKVLPTASSNPFSLSVMRGINDNQFVIDYLTAAITDKNPPVITPVLKN